MIARIETNDEQFVAWWKAQKTNKQLSLMALFHAACNNGLINPNQDLVIQMLQLQSATSQPTQSVETTVVEPTATVQPTTITEQAYTQQPTVTQSPVTSVSQESVGQSTETDPMDLMNSLMGQ